MKRESISHAAFAKGLASCAIVACSLGALSFAEYSTSMRSGDYDFVPGTYSEQADGLESPVTVTITVDNKTITDVQVDVSGETPNIGAQIGDVVTQQILDAQSSAIDGVSGATVSSDAVKAALDAAIADAESGQNAIIPSGDDAMTEEIESELTTGESAR